MQIFQNRYFVCRRFSIFFYLDHRCIRNLCYGRCYMLSGPCSKCCQLYFHRAYSYNRHFVINECRKWNFCRMKVV
jgi:hypothetical protein